VVPATLALAVACAACGSGGTGSSTKTTSAPATRPLRIFPGPAGLVAGAQPQSDGYMWLLANTGGTADLQQLNLTTGQIAQVVPVPAGSAALAQSPSGLLGVGLATSSTGAVEFLNGASGAPVATVPLGAPVKGVAAGADGVTFYVLNGTPTSVSVTLVDSRTDKVSITVPAPLDTVAIAVDPQGQHLFALRSGGEVDEITVATGAVTSTFSVGSHPVQLVTSDTGGTLYVLKEAEGGGSGVVGVITVATEEQRAALPAPAHSVGLQLAPDGQSMYVVVGTPTIGNVQQFALRSPS
jgi:DNA-binding beta-propeller fold protein YncE